MLKNKFALFLFLIISLLILLVALFWRELYELGEGAVSSIMSTSAKQEPMRNADFSRIKDVRFEGESLNLSKIRVSNLKIIDKGATFVTLSVRISSSEGSSEFPYLRVEVFSADGKRLRTVEFSDKEYVHGSSLGSEIIELSVQVKPGDASFKVSAFYKSEK